MARELPDTIISQRAGWWRAYVIFITLHYALGGVGTVCVALVSLTDKAPEVVRDHVGLFGLASVICSGLMTFGRVKEQAIAFLRAYRRLNSACIRYENDDSFPISELVKIHDHGEEIIEKADA